MATLNGGKIVLVTGASGKIGGRLLAELSRRGWRTRALVHKHPAPGADHGVEGDLSDPASLAGATQEADAVLHMAASTHARRTGTYMSVNRDGTTALVEAARAASVGRFVYVSTRAIAADGGGYSKSKRAGEEVVRGSGLDHAIVRLPEVVGAGSREGVDGVIDRARRGAPIPIVGSGNSRLCPAHIDDVVPAIASALDAPADRTYTLAGDCVTEREFARACIHEFNSKSSLVPVPVAAVAALGWASRLVPIPLFPDQLVRLRSSKPGVSPEAERDLGFAPRSLGDSLHSIAAESAG